MKEFDCTKLKSNNDNNYKISHFPGSQGMMNMNYFFWKIGEHKNITKLQDWGFGYHMI